MNQTITHTAFNLKNLENAETSLLSVILALKHYFQSVITIKIVVCLVFLSCLINIQPAKAQNIKGLSKYDTTLMSIHSPAKATFYSAALPGLGQIYNKRYWKVPILYAGIGGLVYAISIHNDYYSRYKQAFLIKISNDPNAKVEEELAKYEPDQLRKAMDQRRRWRDLCILSLAGVYLANVIDATVDAYLFDYDVSQDLSLRIEPAVFQTPSNTSLGLSCKFKF